MEIWENVLVFSLKQDLVYSHQTLAEVWLFFLIERLILCSWGEHQRELLKYHEYFPVLLFDGSLSIEIAFIKISRRYHYVINLGIVSNFYISIDPVYPESCIRGSFIVGELRNLGCPFSIDHWNHYLQWFLIGYNWSDIYKIFVFYFHYPCLILSIVQSKSPSIILFSLSSFLFPI